jgi:hypothetical protein
MADNVSHHNTWYNIAVCRARVGTRWLRHGSEMSKSIGPDSVTLPLIKRIGLVENQMTGFPHEVGDCSF